MLYLNESLQINVHSEVDYQHNYNKIVALWETHYLNESNDLNVNLYLNKVKLRKCKK